MADPVGNPQSTFVPRSRSVFGTIGASLQTLVGGNITLLSSLCEKTRQHAFELMLNHAAEMGANAVVGAPHRPPKKRGRPPEGGPLAPPFFGGPKIRGPPPWGPPPPP